ncbi:aromatic amino acid ammonia-lyase [Acetobacter sp.]|jgi:histidine ammonia-lyase|uniref:aromatic amino acid ammonia-lyase n=1 Tax=Acetobacter sp. TaxID=440 RepID=UPI0025BBFBA7|nr:aromatic amino acid ammonia-lyase [Acetobacter sp.]MCH4089792.1 aromatic amino acid lyase [Acetobacter sp.]MCI1298488.1 aromatic amino acid lyase [Acetobacter sp.]
MTVFLDGSSLTIEELVRVAREKARIELTDLARERIRRSRMIVDETYKSGKTVYGLNTGVGVLKRANVDGDVAFFNRRMLEFHQLAQGPLYKEEIVRAATCRLINQYASGVSGVRLELVEHLVAGLNWGDTFTVHADGNLLLTNADFAIGLVGDFDLSYGEALTLLGQTTLTDAQAALLLHDLGTLLGNMEAAAALSLEGFAAKLSPLDERVAALKKVKGFTESSEKMRSYLQGSTLFHTDQPRNLQDPCSFRNTAYLTGSLRDCLEYTRRVISNQLNSSAGNPVVDLESATVLHAPNWEIQNVASALDFVKISLVPPAFASQECTIKLLDKFWSGLPTGLVGTAEQSESGLAMYQILVASYAYKLKFAAAPTSFDVTTTSQAEGIEDRETGGVFTISTLKEMLDLTKKIVAIEFVVAAQAAELRREAEIPAGLQSILKIVRETFPFVRIGDALPRDFSGLLQAMDAGRMIAA